MAVSRERHSRIQPVVGGAALSSLGERDENSLFIEMDYISNLLWVADGCNRDANLLDFLLMIIRMAVHEQRSG